MRVGEGIPIYALDGLEDLSDFGSLRKSIKKVGQKVQTVAKKVGTTVQKVAKKIGKPVMAVAAPIPTALVLAAKSKKKAKERARKAEAAAAAEEAAVGPEEEVIVEEPAQESYQEMPVPPEAGVPGAPSSAYWPTPAYAAPAEGGEEAEEEPEVAPTPTGPQEEEAAPVEPGAPTGPMLPAFPAQVKGTTPMATYLLIGAGVLAVGGLATFYFLRRRRGNAAQTRRTSRAGVPADVRLQVSRLRG